MARDRRVEKERRWHVKKKRGNANWRDERVLWKMNPNYYIYRNGRLKNGNWTYGPVSGLMGSPTPNGGYRC